MLVDCHESEHVEIDVMRDQLGDAHSRSGGRSKLDRIAGGDSLGTTTRT